MIDPRDAAVAGRLAGIRRILLFAGGKGGVGKSACASVGALALARAGMSVGLLDLDFEGASCHTFLGSKPRFPEENRGLFPLEEAFGLRFATVVSFTADRPVALRGADLSSALLEILSVTIWGRLDALLIDMPPGMGDQLLDLMRLVRNAEALAITTPSPVSIAVTARLLSLLAGTRLSIAGVVENMARGASRAGAGLAEAASVPLLASLPYDPSIEDAIGKPELLVGGAFGRAIGDLLAGVLKNPRAR